MHGARRVHGRCHGIELAIAVHVHDASRVGVGSVERHRQTPAVEPVPQCVHGKGLGRHVTTGVGLHADHRAQAVIHHRHLLGGIGRNSATGEVTSAHPAHVVVRHAVGEETDIAHHHDGGHVAVVVVVLGICYRTGDATR